MSRKNLKTCMVKLGEILRHPVKTAFKKNVRFKSYGQKTPPKRLKLAKNPISAVFAQFFGHNSWPVHFFEKLSSQEVLEFPVVLPCKFSDFFENLNFLGLEGSILG